MWDTWYENKKKGEKNLYHFGQYGLAYWWKHFVKVSTISLVQNRLYIKLLILITHWSFFMLLSLSMDVGWSLANHL